MQPAIPTNWPFRTYNGQNASSRTLQERKVPKYKPVYPDAPFVNFTGE